MKYFNKLLFLFLGTTTLKIATPFPVSNSNAAKEDVHITEVDFVISNGTELAPNKTVEVDITVSKKNPKQNTGTANAGGGDAIGSFVSGVAEALVGVGSSVFTEDFMLGTLIAESSQIIPGDTGETVGDVLGQVSEPLNTVFKNPLQSLQQYFEDRRSTTPRMRRRTTTAAPTTPMTNAEVSYIYLVNGNNAAAGPAVSNGQEGSILQTVLGSQGLLNLAGGGGAGSSSAVANSQTFPKHPGNSNSQTFGNQQGGFNNGRFPNQQQGGQNNQQFSNQQSGINNQNFANQQQQQGGSNTQGFSNRPSSNQQGQNRPSFSNQQGGGNTQVSAGGSNNQGFSNNQGNSNGQRFPNNQDNSNGQRFSNNQDNSNGQRFPNNQDNSNGQRFPNNQDNSNGQRFPNNQGNANGQGFSNNQGNSNGQRYPTNQGNSNGQGPSKNQGNFNGQGFGGFSSNTQGIPNRFNNKNNNGQGQSGFANSQENSNGAGFSNNIGNSNSQSFANEPTGPRPVFPRRPVANSQIDQIFTNGEANPQSQTVSRQPVEDDEADAKAAAGTNNLVNPVPHTKFKYKVNNPSAPFISNQPFNPNQIDNENGPDNSISNVPEIGNTQQFSNFQSSPNQFETGQLEPISETIQSKPTNTNSGSFSSQASAVPIFPNTPTFSKQPGLAGSNIQVIQISDPDTPVTEATTVSPPVAPAGATPETEDEDDDDEEETESPTKR